MELRRVCYRYCVRFKDKQNLSRRETLDPSSSDLSCAQGTTGIRTVQSWDDCLLHPFDARLRG